MVEINIPMPSDCYGCWIRQNMGCGFANDTGWLNDRRDDRCPLKSREPEYPMRKQGKHGWFWYCPKCDTILNDMARPKYCDRCGQAVKWE